MVGELTHMLPVEVMKLLWLAVVLVGYYRCIPSAIWSYKLCRLQDRRFSGLMVSWW
jgi:hypothetical protein